jgi:hypothetical protein
VPAFASSRTEAVAAASVSIPAFLIVLAYFADRVGLPLAPFTLLGLSLVASIAATLTGRDAESRRNGAELVAFAAVVGAVFAWIVSLAWPRLLPMGGGADLIHHLQLIDYIERHGHLVRDRGVEAYLGEMTHYTPGSHLLAVVAGAWADSDGFHSYHLIAAASVALKAGLVFLIARRLMPDGVPAVPLALGAVLLLPLPHFYFVGSFARYSYFAQVVSELFAVAMWWALVAWIETPTLRPAAMFGLWGSAAFLTWPIWIGPPVVTFAAAIWLSRRQVLRTRILAVLASAAPIALAAGVHMVGRVGWLSIAQTGAEVRIPRAGDFGVVFLGLGVAGFATAVVRRRGMALVAFAAAIGLQSAALYALATARGAQIPYMAIKMVHLALYPAAVAGALAGAEAWRIAMSTAVGHWFTGHRAALTAWISVGIAATLVIIQAARVPLQPPTVSQPLYEAGRWARANLPAECVDYIAADELTSYWLHLAVLGSRRISERTADDRTFELKDAVMRWILPGGLPYAVADLSVLPRDIRDQTKELFRSGSALVIAREGVCSR